MEDYIKELKGDHKIGIRIPKYEELLDNPKGVYVCDAESEEWNDGYIPDYTPDWLYKILEELHYDEIMESYFSFENASDLVLMMSIVDEIIFNE